MRKIIYLYLIVILGTSVFSFIEDTGDSNNFEPLKLESDVKVCPAIYAPVCGVDGVTYSNSCTAKNVEIAYEGVCSNESKTENTLIQKENENRALENDIKQKCEDITDEVICGAQNHCKSQYSQESVSWFNPFSWFSKPSFTLCIGFEENEESPSGISYKY